MRRPLTIFAAVAAAALCCAGGLALFASWTRGQEADAWPTLDDEPPLSVEVAPPDAGWAALLPLLELPELAEERIQDSVEIEGAPLDPGFWVLVADELDELDVVLRSHATITPPALDLTTAFPDLMPVLTLGRALCLRGWTSYESSDYAAAVDDMLAADVLGKRLAASGQNLVAVAVGLALQDIALVEMEELLAVVDDPDAHQRAEAGLARNAAATDRTRRTALVDCAGFEEMFRDFGDNPALLSQQAGTGEPASEPEEPGVVDRINALRYDADATIAQHRRNCRARDAWLSAPPVERTPEPPDVMPEVSEMSGYNRTGLTLLSIATPPIHSRVDEEHRVALRRSGLRLLTAARRYAYDHDRQLPTSADALVPGYLPAAFSDPFSVSPLGIEGGQIQTGEPSLSWSVEMPEGR